MSHFLRFFLPSIVIGPLCVLLCIICPPQITSPLSQERVCLLRLFHSPFLNPSPYHFETQNYSLVTHNVRRATSDVHEHPFSLQSFEWPVNLRAIHRNRERLFSRLYSNGSGLFRFPFAPPLTYSYFLHGSYSGADRVLLSRPSHNLPLCKLEDLFFFLTRR